MKKIFSFIILAMIIFQNFAVPPKIILKFDDIAVKNNGCSAQGVLDILLARKIKASLGFIANRSDATAKAYMAPYLNETNDNGEQLFEVWNHGYDHVNPEFKGTGYTYQKQHFEDADALIKSLVGVQSHSFGAPFNATDADTYQVLSENDNYKVIMLGSTPPASSELMNLNQRVNLESSTANPSYATFLNNYNNKKGVYTDYMVVQAHPNNWDDSKKNELIQMLDFLISEGCEFVTPYEYYLSLQPALSLDVEKKNNLFQIDVKGRNVEIENKMPYETLSLSIYSISGQKVYEKKNIQSKVTIPCVSRWLNQMMIFKIEHGGTIITSKILVK